MKVWTLKEDALLIERYPDERNDVLALEFRCSRDQVAWRAMKLGVQKSREYRREQARIGRLQGWAREKSPNAMVSRAQWPEWLLPTVPEFSGSPRPAHTCGDME